MGKIPFVPPEIPHLSDEEIEHMKTYKLSKEKRKYIHEKYEKPLQEREHKLKKKKRSEWWRNNWINVIATVGTVIGIIIALIELLSK